MKNNHEKAGDPICHEDYLNPENQYEQISQLNPKKSEYDEDYLVDEDNHQHMEGPHNIQEEITLRLEEAQHQTAHTQKEKVQAGKVRETIDLSIGG